MRDGKVLNNRELAKLRKARQKAAKRNGESMKRSNRKLNAEQKQAAVRSKYGPTGRPSPVTVKRLDGETGEWVVEKVVDQSKLGAGSTPKRPAKRHWRPRPKGQGSLVRAQRALEANREQIERSARGTPSRKPKEWRMGQGPGASGSA